MWRGPVWVNINYIFVEALRQVGEFDLARTLREKTLALIMEQPGIHEYYHAETGIPPTTAASAFGWTAAVFIDLVIQASREEGAPELVEGVGPEPVEGASPESAEGASPKPFEGASSGLSENGRT
jgi:glycogen debranching enzyme